MTRNLHSGDHNGTESREGRELYRKLFENANDAIFIMDGTTIIDCNPLTMVMFGRERDLMVGCTPLDFSPEHQSNGVLSTEKLKEKMDVVLSGATAMFEWRYERAGGALFDVEISLSRLDIPDKSLIMAIIRDITERKHLQNIMMQTEKMIMVGGLVAGMAHELNNPLGSILQNIQNIQRRISPGLPANDAAADEIGVDFTKVQEYLQRRGIFELLRHISNGGTRAAAIISKLLAFSRTGATKLDLTGLPQMIDSALELAACDYDLKKIYGFKRIEIVRQYEPGMPSVVLNRPEMEEVLINLLKNAAQALKEKQPGKSPRIIVRTKREGGDAVIEVEDNGPGMTEEVSKRVFDPFFTTREVGVGTGLGLSVVYALVVNNHGGTISVDSVPDVGTVVTVTLPLRTEDQE